MDIPNPAIPLILTILIQTMAAGAEELTGEGGDALAVEPAQGNGWDGNVPSIH